MQTQILETASTLFKCKIVLFFQKDDVFEFEVSINVRDILNLLYTSSHWILSKKNIGLLFSSPKMRMRFAKITCQIIVEISYTIILEDCISQFPTVEK